MKLVTTTGDLSPFFESKSIAAPLRAMKDTGFSNIDMSFYNVIYPGSPWVEKGDSWKKEVEDCLKIADSEGFDFRQAHAPDGEHYIQGEERDILVLVTKRTIEACKMLGIPHIVIHGGSPREQVSRIKSLEMRRDFFSEFEEICEQTEVAMLNENGSTMWSPNCIMNTGKDMREFVDMAKLPMLHCCWDTGHAHCSGTDQYSDIIAMGDELKAFHMQDNLGEGDLHVMPMAGNINFDRVMQGIREIGYQGDFTFEGHYTLRRGDMSKYPRKNIMPGDLLTNPPLFLQQKAMKLMHDVGEWILKSYGYEAE